MAKALVGHLGGVEVRMLDEITRLRRRVEALESEVLRLQAAHDGLLAVLDADDAEVLLADPPRAVTPVLA
jgi:hypothetical protein